MQSLAKCLTLNHCKVKMTKILENDLKKEGKTNPRFPFSSLKNGIISGDLKANVYFTINKR